MGLAPCKGCERRRIGCHTICPEYREWKRVKDAEVERREMEQKSTPDFPRHILRQIWRESRWK